MKIKPGMEKEYAEYKLINGGDPYSAMVVSYGENWANLMESALDDVGPGPLWKDFGEVAKRCAKAADGDGITGSMYGCAVSALAHFWENGDTLRSWHNREYLSEEKAATADANGGTVNPAIITLGE